MDRDLPYLMPDEELVARELAAEASVRARGGGNRSKSTGGAKKERNDAPAGAAVIDPRAPYDTARLFRARLASPLHHHRGVFYEWNGASWPEAGEDRLRARLYSFLDQCQSKTKGGFCSVKPNAQMVGGVLDALRAAAHLESTIEPPAWLDGADGPPAHEIIACYNGLLHLPTRRQLPHTPPFLKHNAVDYAYQPNAPEPQQWLAFLDQVWPDDPESISTLQQISGYLLTSDTSQQKSALIIGPKRSGKGTIARVMARLVGPHNCVSPTLASLGERFGLAPLIGKSLAIVSDARLSGRADQQIIVERLLSISGEDRQTIDRKYSPQPWKGKLPTRFAIMTNELPKLGDASGALASRFVMLLMTRSFYGQEDHGLTDRLLTELPSILNWAIAGWAALQRRGSFQQPASARQALEQLEDLSSPIGACVREHCEIGPSCTVEVEEIFDAWKTWCEAQGRNHPGTKQSFGRGLSAAVPGLTAAQLGSCGERVRVYLGLKLKGDWSGGPTTPDF